MMLSAAISAAACYGMAAGESLAQAAQEEEIVQMPVVTMSKESGCYPEAFLLKLTCKEARTIYYTTDGSNPAVSSTRKEYTGAISVTDRKDEANVLAAVDPVLFDCAYSSYDQSECSAPKDSEVDKATIIRAVGMTESGAYTEVVTNTYFVGAMTEHIQGIEESCKAAGIPLAIMSLSMEYDDLFDYEKGIYVRGKIFEEAYHKYISGEEPWVSELRKLEANYTQRGSAWERVVHIDYLESDGKTTDCKLQQDCGTRVQGNYSRSDLQKGFRLYAKKDYGAKNFNYAFFGEDVKDDTGAVLSKFKRLVLRNGGNASFLAKYNDAFWQSLLTELNCDTQASRVCIVYLNGEYWGIYILQEDFNDDYFENVHGVKKEDVIVYKGDAEKYESGYKLDEGTLPGGETDEGYYLKELMDFFSTHSNLEKEEDYQEFAKLVDIDSVRDYFAAQIWVNNKWDWPGKNWTMWKAAQTDASNPYADGKWRLCFYDLDFGGISGGWSAYDNTIQVDNYKEYGLLDMCTENPVVLCYAYLMSNKGFRDSFKQRITELDQGVFEKNAATKVCEKFLDIYKPLYQQYFTRFFGSDHAKYYTEGAVSGGYGSYRCIIEFINNRSEYLPEMLKWVDDFYKTHTIYNSDLAGEEPEPVQKKKTIEKLMVSARKGTSTIKVKTLKKSKVVITLSKKIIKSGKKTVKKTAISSSQNKTGTISVKLSKKLAKGVKVVVKVSKAGYKAKTKTVTVK